jgi:hypothetical protein
MDSAFFNFVMTGETTKADETPPADVPDTESGTVTWRELGEAIASAIDGFAATKDVYGNGPEAHGAAYKVAGDKKADIEQFLTSVGFTLKGAYSWYADNLRVDIGVSKGTTYCYITDDAGKKSKELEVPDGQWGQVSYKHVPGQHDQETHGNRGEETIYKPGDIVMFSNPVNAAEEKHRMKILEDRGNRVLVEDQVNMNILPTTVLLKSDIKPVGSQVGPRQTSEASDHERNIKKISSQINALNKKKNANRFDPHMERAIAKKIASLSNDRDELQRNLDLMRNKELETLKHLPGQHDQATHGDRGANAKGGRMGEITSNVKKRIRLTEAVDRENKKGNTAAFRKAKADLDAFDKAGGVFKKKPASVSFKKDDIYKAIGLKVERDESGAITKAMLSGGNGDVFVNSPTANDIDASIDNSIFKYDKATGKLTIESKSDKIPNGIREGGKYSWVGGRLENALNKKSGEKKPETKPKRITAVGPSRVYNRTHDTLAGLKSHIRKASNGYFLTVEGDGKGKRSIHFMSEKDALAAQDKFHKEPYKGTAAYDKKHPVNFTIPRPEDKKKGKK